jgi:hypothetical protein
MEYSLSRLSSHVENEKVEFDADIAEIGVGHHPRTLSAQV